MPSCLGLYIENNLIKYAKVSKEKDIVKVEAFGIKFYDNFSDAINQIIEETYSFKVPVSINLSEEMYNYFNIFSLLKEKDLPKIISNEFEFLCEEKGYNINALESRHTIVTDIENRENLRVIHVSANKTELIKRSQQLDKYRLSGVVPLPISISNLIELGPKDNALIINTENKTNITTIINGKPYKVDNIDIGMGDVLDKINIKENSYAKSYEICKNTTIYTSESIVEEQTNEYLEDIMPILYNIVKESKKVLDETIVAIDKIYITGSMSVINNIDLYFEQNIPNMTCQVLRPHFIERINNSVNVKDYIEVNSAISIALLALGEGTKGVNFQKNSMLNGITIGGKGQKQAKSKNSGKKLDFNFSLKGQFDTVEKGLIRSASGLLLVLVIYIILSLTLSGMIKSKKIEADTRLAETNAQISLANNDINTVKELADRYIKLKQNLDDLSSLMEEKSKNKNSIPNLLNKIMFIIPEGVQITSIENTTDKHIVIKAQAAKYEQLGYFKAQLKADYILSNVTSDSGYKQDSVIKVTIEGDLP